MGKRRRVMSSRLLRAGCTEAGASPAPHPALRATFSAAKWRVEGSPPLSPAFSRGRGCRPSRLRGEETATGEGQPLAPYRLHLGRCKLCPHPALRATFFPAKWRGRRKISMPTSAPQRPACLPRYGRTGPVRTCLRWLPPAANMCRASPHAPHRRWSSWASPEPHHP
jgi:hypothetical protein